MPAQTGGRSRYLLTFRPFGQLPGAGPAKLPGWSAAPSAFPGSLGFLGDADFCPFAKTASAAGQIPLRGWCPAAPGCRGACAQSGWLHEPHPDVIR